MRRVLVKVCGIRDERDALECVHVGVDVLGFHLGADSPRALEPRVGMKAFRVGARFRPDALARYACTTYVLDAWKPPDTPPDSERFDWARARGFALHGRIVIGGGLDPDNVAAAVEKAVPYGV